MPKRDKVHYIRVDRDILAHSIEVNEFDWLVDEGYDDIVIITPKARLIASIDEWLDYSFIDLEGDVEVRTLMKSYMGRM